MKLTLKNIVLAVALPLVLGSCAASVGVVATAPPPPVVVRPVAPGPGVIWVDGDYYWSGGRYVYRQGYWARPRRGRSWQAGHWQAARGGWQWRRGHWR